MTEYNFKSTYEPGSLDEIVAGEIAEKEILPKEYSPLKKVIKDSVPAIIGGLVSTLFLCYYMS